MKRPILIIGAIALLGFGADAVRAQTIPTLSDYEPGDQPIPALEASIELESAQPAQLNLVPSNACDTHAGASGVDQACRRQVNDFKAGMKARKARGGDEVAFNDGSDEQDGLRLDGLKLKAYHRF